ncbi:MAG: hypothetical protein WC543_00320 [Candidatus Omnitrophota bacterium]
MIVAMKKVIVVTQAKDSLDVLNKLQAQGVLHIEHVQPPKGNDVILLTEEIALLDQALSILSSIPLEKKPVVDNENVDAKLVYRHVIDLHKRKDQLVEYLTALTLKIKQYQDWGDFDPQDFANLAQKNIFAGLYQIPLKQLKEITDAVVINQLSVKGGIANCLVVAKKKIEIGFKEISLPAMSLGKMLQRKEEDLKAIKALEKQLIQQVPYQKELIKFRDSLQKKLEFQETFAGMGQSEQLVFLKGYLPINEEMALVALAKQKGWGIFTSVPSQEDEVPTLVRNPRWIALIKPLLKLLELVPGYRELDISPLFIIFFSLFFGMLIGDAGYGLVYLMLNFWLHKKFGYKIKDQSVFFLFYILSFCAIIWGLLTATFFGQAWLLNLGIKPLIPALGNASFIQAFCFFIGALHLSFAHGWRAILKAPALIALADLGWICVIWAVFFLAKNLILGDLYPGFSNGLIISGLILVLFFTSPQKNILKTIGAGLGTIALSLVNNFTDVVSYIRLFAVGLAGVAIADAFNAMAAGVFKKGDFLTIVAAALIVIMGHALNIILGPMSVLVHGVRLNVLEFCGHANVTWSGFAYKPFGRKEN